MAEKKTSYVLAHDVQTGETDKDGKPTGRVITLPAGTKLSLTDAEARVFGSSLTPDK